MRILPAALYFHREQLPEFLNYIHEVSAITHAHPRSLIGCGIYALLVRELLTTDDKLGAFRKAVELAMNYYQKKTGFETELSHYMRIISLSIPNLVESEINSSGYIIDTLEASIWCFLKHDNSRDILLSAVKLGLDTTGAVAGGLAGLAHGTDNIPEAWLDSLARKDEIKLLINRFAEKVALPA
jgi:ADP-ribosyl-[dinitrogen reductase] hydrolase